MKNYKKMFMMALILIFVLSGSIICYSSSNESELSDLFPETETNTTYEEIYDKYPISHFSFDTKKFGVLDILAKAINTLTNGIFIFNAILAKFASKMIIISFNLSIFDFISDIFDDIIFALKDSIFNPLAKTILPIVGVVILINAIILRIGTVIKLVTNTIIILVIAYFFMSKPSFFIQQVTNFSENVSNEILIGTTTVATGQVTSADNAVVGLANTFFESTVIKPWGLIQFGDVETGNLEKDNFLKYQIGTNERNQVKKAYEDNNFLFTSSGQIIRAIMALFLTVLTFFIIIFTLILCGMINILQMAGIISAIFLILAFAISLLPNMGLRVTTRALFNTFSFTLGKIGVTLVFSVYFTLNHCIYKLSNEYGWIVTMILQILVLVTLFVFRNKIMGFATEVANGQDAMLNNINRPKEPIMNKALATYGTYRLVNQGYKGIQYFREKSIKKDLKPIANGYLSQKYMKDKKAAEDIAKKESVRTGKRIKPEYSEFVKNADYRVDKGFNAFSDQQIDSTVSMMRNIKKEGNDPRKILNTSVEGKTDQQISRDQDLLRKETFKTQKELKNRAINNKAASIRMVRNCNKGALDEIENEKREKVYRDNKIQESKEIQNEIKEEKKVVGESEKRPFGESIKNEATTENKEVQGSSTTKEEAGQYITVKNKENIKVNNKQENITSVEYTQSNTVNEKREIKGQKGKVQQGNSTTKEEAGQHIKNKENIKVNNKQENITSVEYTQSNIVNEKREVKGVQGQKGKVEVQGSSTTKEEEGQYITVKNKENIKVNNKQENITSVEYTQSNTVNEKREVKGVQGQKGKVEVQGSSKTKEEGQHITVKNKENIKVNNKQENITSVEYTQSNTVNEKREVKEVQGQKGIVKNIQKRIRSIEHTQKNVVSEKQDEKDKLND